MFSSKRNCLKQGVNLPLGTHEYTGNHGDNLKNLESKTYYVTTELESLNLSVVRSKFEVESLDRK